MKALNNVEILLASQSPRRAFLLEQINIKFRQISPNIEENYPEDMDLYHVPLFLAEKKAISCIDKLLKKEILLSSDSVVIFENEILGKPESRDEAIEFLLKMSGSMHEVVTGVCLANADKRVVFNGYTKVFFHSMEKDEVEYYLDHFKPYDKAGSYGIQDWIGWAKISKIEGSYSNVMGLPLAKLYEEIQRF
jgi:septum formation protein